MHREQFGFLFSVEFLGDRWLFARFAIERYFKSLSYQTSA